MPDERAGVGPDVLRCGRPGDQLAGRLDPSLAGARHAHRRPDV